MDATHLHLLLNHFPTIGTLIGVILIAYALVTDNTPVKKAGLLILVGVALISIVVFNTGEEAEETVEHIAGISHHQIHEHEEAAETAVWLMYAVGLLAIVSYGMMRAKMVPAKIICIATLILGIITLVMMVEVGNEGGKIRHAQELNAVTTPASDNHSDGDHDD